MTPPFSTRPPSTSVSGWSLRRCARFSVRMSFGSNRGARAGTRQAEVLGLQWGDIDWNRRSAEIRRQWRRGAFYAPKTKASRRTVELPDELVSALKRWRLRCPKGEYDLVCPNAKGGPMQSSDLLRTGLHPALRR